MTYCQRCERYFSNWYAYKQHANNSSNHNICDDCDEDFPNWLRLKQHLFRDLEDHVEESHWACLPCRRLFANEAELREHYKQSDDHHYCTSCNGTSILRATSIRTLILQFTVQKRSMPTRVWQCLRFPRHCLLHLESGACTSGYDTNNVITTPRHMITGGSASGDITYIATSRSWNGSGYECYLCHGIYSTLGALNQHLASPRHQDKIYRCLGPSCEYRCSALSALVQHIESNKCRGSVRN
ncbi:hypothetical protein CPB84DRAFT_1834193 [Gymnopilus junonius]|uniref:C2H2-type domain-containing protein n=1 Tax=Gymnopilus junonius TaxID=109634 RepID=A0A9P5TT57_GYMJU|nr:hypothetical protein CPB84DRAFT_1834193 [Gymnopilus junonius]